MREQMEILIAVAVLLGMGVLFLWGEHHRIEEQLNYKYHLVCGDTDHGVVYRLKENTASSNLNDLTKRTNTTP